MPGTGKPGPLEFRFPVPGSRFPLSPPSERQLEGQVHPASQLAHLFLREVGGLLLGLDDGDENEILEHLDIGGIHDGRIDLDLADLAFAVGLDRDHTATGRGVYRSRLELILDLLETTLHLLRLLQDLHDVGHQYRVRW